MGALLLVDGDGVVCAVNGEAATLGLARGLRCCDAVAARDVEGVPICSSGCTSRLLRGTRAAPHEGARARGGWWRIVCTPMGDRAIVELAPDAPPTHAALSAREREVLDHVAQGLSTPEIAVRLGLSRSTVKTHVENARRKLGARTRAEAVARR